MFEAELQVKALISTLRSLPDFREAQGREFSLVVLGFSLFVTELAKLKTQRRRARGLKANWKWMIETLGVYGELKIPDRAPSQSTLSRALSGIDFWALIQQHLREIRAYFLAIPYKANHLVHYGVDGKRREGQESKATGRTEFDVTIYAVETRTVLAKSHVSDKKGESRIFRRLLRSWGFELPRGVFTMDAGITSPKALGLVLTRGHEYIAAIKGNCGRVFELAFEFDWEARPKYKTEDKGHGRHETRIIEIIPLSQTDDYDEFEKYPECGAVLRVTAIRKCLHTGSSSAEIRYFITSKGLARQPLRQLLKWVRNHWLQENHLHWSKDALLGEDEAREKSVRSSRVLGFFKDMVVSIAYGVRRTISELTDSFQFEPQLFWRPSS